MKSIILLTLLAGCSSALPMEITSPDLNPRPIPSSDRFIANLPPKKWLNETIKVRIVFQRDSVDASIVCDEIFLKYNQTKCTYACALNTQPYPTIYMEKPRGKTNFESRLLDLINIKGYDSLWVIGPQGEIDYPKSGKRYENLFIHEIGGHGYQGTFGMYPDHKNFVRSYR